MKLFFGILCCHIVGVLTHLREGEDDLNLVDELQDLLPAAESLVAHSLEDSEVDIVGNNASILHSEHSEDELVID